MTYWFALASPPYTVPEDKPHPRRLLLSLPIGCLLTYLSTAQGTRIPRFIIHHYPSPVFIPPTPQLNHQPTFPTLDTSPSATPALHPPKIPPTTASLAPLFLFATRDTARSTHLIIRTNRFRNEHAFETAHQG